VAEVLSGYAGPVAAMSFDPHILMTLQKHAPGLPRGIVAERYYDDPEWRLLTRVHKIQTGQSAAHPAEPSRTLSRTISATFRPSRRSSPGIYWA
jgi:hypothetical protein